MPRFATILLAATAVVVGEMNGPDHVFDPIRPLHALTNWPPAAPILRYPLVHTVTERVRRFETRPPSRLRRRRRPSRPMSRIENRTGHSWSKSWRTSRRYDELRNKRRALRPNILNSPFARSASSYIYMYIRAWALSSLILLGYQFATRSCSSNRSMAEKHFKYVILGGGVAAVSLPRAPPSFDFLIGFLSFILFVWLREKVVDPRNYMVL